MASFARSSLASAGVGGSVSAGGRGEAAGREEGSAGRALGRGVGDREAEAATRGEEAGVGGREGRVDAPTGPGDREGRSRGPIIKEAATPSRAIVPRPSAPVRAVSRREGRGGTGVAGAEAGSPGALGTGAASPAGRDRIFRAWSDRVIQSGEPPRSRSAWASSAPMAWA